MKHGFYWHVHHDKLVEWCYDEKERLRAIRSKPAREVALRVRLFKPILQVPPGLVEAYAAYDKAWAAYNKAYTAAMPELELLHKQECPDCPWDGQTIFPEKKNT